MENLEILQEKYKDLFKEHKQLHKDYFLLIKENSTLRNENKKLKELLKPQQKKEFELDQMLCGQMVMTIGGNNGTPNKVSIED